MTTPSQPNAPGATFDPSVPPRTGATTMLRQAAAPKAEKPLLATPVLPKGGGALSGLDGELGVNAQTGTATLSIPLALPAARGLAPSIALRYDSGGGAGVLGIGWSLSVPRFTRRLDKGTPRYADSTDSDIFVGGGVGELVPWSLPHVPPPTSDDPLPSPPAGIDDRGETTRDGFRVRSFRPREDSLEASIERWTELGVGSSHWRVANAANVTSIYGLSTEARVADPAHPATRVLDWLLDRTFDDRGNVVEYAYVAEDDIGVDAARVEEAGRLGEPQAQRYLKRVRWGNKTPYAEKHGPGHTPHSATDFSFELVLDYGDHGGGVDPETSIADRVDADVDVVSAEVPAFEPDRAWVARDDSRSTFRAGFEIRTRRRLERLLLFHRFTALNGGTPTLVRSWELEYDTEPYSGIARLRRVWSTAWQPGDGGDFVARSLPPTALSYTGFAANTAVHTLAGGEARDLDATNWGWSDLDGTGLPGLVHSQGGNLWFRQNQGGGRLAPPSVLLRSPGHALGSGLDGTVALMDVRGDGTLGAVSLRAPAGFVDRRRDGGWEPFRRFRSVPVLDDQGAEWHLLDVDGDGRADLLVATGGRLHWYRSLGEDGFAAPLAAFDRVDDPIDSPRSLFASGTEAVLLADMSGDGLADIVRVRNGSIVYWPNLGNGRFGDKITMGDAPWLDRPERFDARRVHLGDVDGSGVADLLYAGGPTPRLYLNQSGNRWGAGITLPGLPPTAGTTTLALVDLLGKGSACVTWMRSLPGMPNQPAGYIDLCRPVGETDTMLGKPHLLSGVSNSMGARRELTYAPSTKFSLADQRAGRPWVTKLPFPLHVVEKTVTTDLFSGGVFTRRYRYHHGYYDRKEREFRGFGRVDTLDAEPFDGATAWYTAPIEMRTWFELGASVEGARIAKAFTSEYYSPPDGAPDPRLLAARLPAGGGRRWHDVCRALRGRPIRTEVYGVDGTESQMIPYAVTESTSGVRLLQERVGERPAVVAVLPRETLTLHTERNPADPRVAHSAVLEVDAHLRATKSVAIAYPRIGASGSTSPETRHGVFAVDRDVEEPRASWYTQPTGPEQAVGKIVLSEASFVHVPNGARADDSRWHRVGLPVTTASGEVTSLAIPGDGSLLSFAALREALVDDYAEAALVLLGRVETRYAADPTGATPADPVVLALGTVESLALPFETYTLAITHAERVATFGDLLDGEAPETLGTSLGYEVREADEDEFDWWLKTGQVVVDPGAFFQPVESISRFGARSSIAWDDDALLVESATDALGNTIAFENDYRVLAPLQQTDANDNRTAIALDVLGRVVATATMGKAGDDEGDSLENPGARFAYALSGPSAEDPTPAWARSWAREEHANDVPWDDAEAPRVLESVTYSDGFGRVISAKARVEPDPDELSPMHEQRWVASGRIVYDNKGNPVRQYEPYFTADDGFEPDADARTFGVSPTMFYDPLGRVVEVQHPDETRTVTAYGGWAQIAWDRNDTASESGLYPARRAGMSGTTWPAEPPDPVPAPWLDERLDETPTDDNDDPVWDGVVDVDHANEDDDVNAEETELQHPMRRAALGMALFDDTPTVLHLDVLGRVFATDKWNAVPDGTGRDEEVYREFAELDVLGRTRSLRDARGNTAFIYDYDLAGRLLKQVGVDDGQRRMLPDGSGKPAFGWTGAPVDGDAPYRMRHEYDVAERPTHVWMSVDGGGEALRSYIVYGEDAPGEPEDLNLLTRVWRTFDTAGLLESAGVDFKGNPLGSSRRLIVSNDADPDWSGVADASTLEDADDEADLLLESAAYTTATTFDALSRPVTATTADGSVTSYTYDLGGSLRAQSVQHRGAGSPQLVVSDIQYNARGQRVSASLGNGTVQTYTYDPNTFRLARSRATRTSGGVDLQDLRYTYDPEGNPTEIRDKAQQRTYFNNDVVYPSRRYAYDALYRLIRAEGRETAFAPTSPWSTSPTPEEPVRTGSDPAAMRRYVENFSLDPNGNLLTLEHVVPSNTSASWTRTMAYEAGSNRLATYQGTSGASVEEPAYDELGRMTEAPGIDELAWDADGRLRRTRVSTAGAAETRYVYDGAGNRVRKARYSWVTDAWVKTGETVYVGGIDIDREFVGGEIEGEIESLHLSDAGRRIALVETRTVHEGDAVTTPAGKWRFQHDDHLRSSCVETNASGIVISYEEYHAYGTTAYSAHTSALEERPKRFRYSGKERDEESGLYYYGARYLAPWMGRWISPDPAGTVDGVNLYVFVRGMPSRAFDPNGNECIDGSAGTNSCGDPNTGVLMTSPDTDVAVYAQYGRSNWSFQGEDGKTRALTPDEREMMARIAIQQTAVAVPDAETQALVEVTMDRRALANEQARIANDLRESGAETSTEVLGAMVMVAGARNEVQIDEAIELVGDAFSVAGRVDNLSGPTGTSAPVASPSAVPSANFTPTTLPDGLRRAHSSVARRNANITEAGMQAHHLIPVEVAEQFDVLRYAAENLGFDINSGDFLKAMSTYALDGSASHRGPHPNYTSAVEQGLLRIQDLWRAGGIDDDQLLEHLRDFAAQMSRRIDSGEFTNAAGRLSALQVQPQWMAA